MSVSTVGMYPSRFTDYTCSSRKSHRRRRVRPNLYHRQATADASRDGSPSADDDGPACLADGSAGAAYACAGVPRTVMRSPGRPKMLRISAGLVPVLPNQCGTVVSKVATSPGPRTTSWSPRTKRM